MKYKIGDLVKYKYTPEAMDRKHKDMGFGMITKIFREETVNGIEEMYVLDARSAYREEDIVCKFLTEEVK